MVAVSVIVSVYNEERTIVSILERVKSVSVPGVTFQVVVVDDGGRRPKV